MHFSKQKIRFSISSFFIFLSLALSDPRTNESGLLCSGDNRSSSAPNLIPTFIQEMRSLSQEITARRFVTHQVSSMPSPRTKATTIYALAQCHDDLSQTDCLLCYAVARTRLPRCLPSVSARIFLDGCFLRYDNYSFYSESVSNTSDRYVCSSNEDNAPDPGFRNRVNRVLQSVVRVADGNRGFGVAGEGGAYALAQCWESLGSKGCRECLEKAAREVKRCVPKREGRGMNAGCYLRYSNEKFYNHAEPGEAHGVHIKGAVLAIILATAAFFMLFGLAAYAIFAKYSKIKQEHKNLGLVSTSFSKSSLKFKYDTLEKATDYFSPKKRIGQGGNGSVYLGVLPNGETVAVKRLVFNTRQWVDEFFNEVNLVSGIHHKNLVKLLGCSIEGPESLLVYEYVPNKSLDLFLFGESKTKILTWKRRFNIIVGTAEGLAYLHGGSHTRIIHRDIKSGNVLLDEAFNPKIADFGLARCFAADKTHLSTGIAGTLGYMAPEYVIRGQLTEKADVYSYGVLALEIACGRRNNIFVPESGSLLQAVWKCYLSNRLVEALDPCLKEEFFLEQEQKEEACKVLQIGLLCTQASAALRPSMAELTVMITNSDYPIPIPNQPPFLNTSAVTEAASSARSYSTNSLTSNAATKTQVSSYSSFES